MWRIFGVFPFFMLMLWLALPGAQYAAAQEITATAPLLVVSSPVDGAVIRGVVPITGIVSLAGVQSAELAFADQTDSSGTWILIAQIALPAQSADLTQWDTTTVPDGEYQLRLRALMLDGTVQERVISRLRVNNLLLPEPTAVQPTATPEPPPALTETPPAGFAITQRAQPVLPTNPAAVESEDLQRSARSGVLLVVGVFAAAGAYALARAARR